MGNLILGFIIGIAASWLYRQQFGRVPAFRQLIQKELALAGRQGSVTQLKKRLEALEAKLEELENKPPVLAHAEEDVFSGQNQACTLTMVKGSRMKTADGSAKKKKPGRLDVLNLLCEGRTAEEIARQTGLPRGEVDLIIALKEKKETG